MVISPADANVDNTGYLISVYDAYNDGSFIDLLLFGLETY